MTVLVIGSSGYLGEYVVSELLRRDHDVVGFDLQPGDVDGRNEDNYTFERGDMTSFADLSDVITSHDVTAAIQLAYYGTPENGLLDSAEDDPYHASNTNVTGFGNVLEATRQFDLDSLVWASSTVVYGTPEYYDELGFDTVDEESPTAPNSLYGACKSHNEYLSSMYREEYDLDIAGIRLPLIYGPSRYPGAQPFIVEMFETVAAGGRIELHDGETTWDLLYERDTGPLFASVLETGEFEHAIYNIVGHTVTVRELAALAEAEAPEGAAVSVADGDNAPIPAPLDDSRFHAEFEYRPAYDAERAVRDYIDTLTDATTSNRS
ncbi:NAD-dependent epimerase/dehydratase family protein [Halorubrum sp. CBA1125]|uniref:NAD-dependent epimerase/dehydratase family protein n=1 Tax=Halorubrum sp. CBA1125 TaxID=2668072 RepID=UPI0012E82F8E|nr:NAD(P)-dependent oxidoreductase [Halorubrum sp. CBA1125]MUW13673.1 NAD-dependent epimerase/dehydratase family protein [Halorubrum sp. CBA1125]